MSDPESLWELYPKDVRVEDKKILDPFMRGGTSLVEASRFGAEVVGNDLNPVAWFVTKKQLEAGQTDVEELEEAFEQVKEDVADEITQYYKTPCPNGDHEADVMYNFWVRELDCVSCGHTVSLFKIIGWRRDDTETTREHIVSIVRTVSQSSMSMTGRASALVASAGILLIRPTGMLEEETTIVPNADKSIRLTDAVLEQGGYGLSLYAPEYYCGTCDEQGRDRAKVKGYKPAEKVDRELARKARKEWEQADQLKQFVPQSEIARGAITESSSISGNDLFQTGERNLRAYRNQHIRTNLLPLDQSYESRN